MYSIADLPRETFEDIVEAHMPTLSVKDYAYLKSMVTDYDCQVLFNCENMSISLFQRLKDI